MITRRGFLRLAATGAAAAWSPRTGAAVLQRLPRELLGDLQIRVWQETESPFALVAQGLHELALMRLASQATLACCEALYRAITPGTSVNAASRLIAGGPFAANSASASKTTWSSPTLALN